MIARFPTPFRLVLALTSLLGASACQPSTEAVRPAQPDEASTRRASAPIDLTGSWRLVSFEGGPVDPLPAPEILMLATSRSLRASSQCVQFWRSYDLTEQGLRVRPYGPVLSCMRGLTPTEQAFGDALSNATRAERGGDRLILSSNSQRLVFAPRQASEVVDLTGRWRLRTLHGQMPGDNEAIVLTFAGSTMTAASGFMRAAWTYEQVGGALELTRSNAGTCERTQTPWETQVFDILDTVSSATDLPSEQLLLNGAIAQMELDRLS